jgi:tetratricopeptide (TPR) repeat protein
MTKPKHFHKAPVQTPYDPLAKYAPYARPVLITVGVIVIGLIVFAFFRSRIDSRAANQWREFSIAYYETSFNQAPDALTQFSERFPATPAGLTAEQIAGDILARSGLSKQLQDEAGSRKDLDGARKRFQKVVDESPEKSGLMYERAVYSLAYVLESLRNCDEAVSWYQQLADDEESPFAELSQRGIERCALAKQVGFFEALDNYEAEIIGPAPDISLPERPDISFPSPGDSSAEPPSDVDSAMPDPANADEPQRPAEDLPPSPDDNN